VYISMVLLFFVSALTILCNSYLCFVSYSMFCIKVSQKFACWVHVNNCNIDYCFGLFQQQIMFNVFVTEYK